MILLYPFTIIFSCDRCCPLSWFGRNARLIASVVVLWKSVNPFWERKWFSWLYGGLIQVFYVILQRETI